MLLFKKPDPKTPMLLLMKKVKTDETPPPKKEQEPHKLDALSKLC
jgi:hypothetical protein